MTVTKKTLKEKGLTPTDCANLYVRYCLQNLPYNAEVFAEVADCAPLAAIKYQAVEKAFHSKLASLVKRMEKSLGKHGAKGSFTQIIDLEPTPTDGATAI